MTVRKDALASETLVGNQDTSFLKIVALLCMLVDHLGAAVFTGVADMRVIGRMALPLYAWCLVVGCVKTRDPLRYALRMLLMAAVSQPLYMLALNHTWRDLNILFLLTLGVIAITGIRRKAFFSQFWAPALCFLALGFLKIDYGWRGLAFILLLYLTRQSKAGLVVAYLSFALFWGNMSSNVASLFGVSFPFLTWPGLGDVFSAFFKMQTMIWLSLPLIVLPTHTNIHMPRWLGYALYPAHLIVLIIVRLTYGGATFALLAQGF